MMSVQDKLLSLSPEEQKAVQAFLSVGQGSTTFQQFDPEKFPKLVEQLMVLEEHYDGGVIGYFDAVLKLMHEKESSHYTKFSHPQGFEITDEAVEWGIETLPQICEIYPIGGAGDRLDLVENGEPLPAARLPFGGHTLLDGLIRDLQGREYLYEKRTGKKLITPIAMMTSHEKHNHEHVIDICESANWWGRPKESFAFFSQERVPMITEEGNWAIKGPCELYLKPGGHGVLWKLMEDEGIFDWLEKQGRTKALIRQINNPVAGTDNGLLAFTGIGCHHDMAFGFAACDRKVGAPEGTLVQCARSDGKSGISNIEYPDFAKHHMEDAPVTPDSPYSKYPANTNILFADLKAVRTVAHHLPGMLINMKKTAPCLQPNGETRELHVGRLETTMQNIADELFGLPTFVTYNTRRKTLSVTKKGWHPGEPTQDTPVGAEEERHENMQDLLKNHCKMQVPEHFYFNYHPALGPLWSIIAEKIQGGTLHEGAEMQLELAEFSAKNLNLKGSLLVKGMGKCTLENVTIQNDGIDWKADNTFWSNTIKRKNALEIILEGNSAFYAKDVTFSGGEKIVVPDGHIVVAEEQDGALLLKADPFNG